MQTLWWAAKSDDPGPGTHDDDRVVEDVVGQVTADLGDLLDTADLLPHLAPQLVPLGAGVGLGGVGLHPMVTGAAQFLASLPLVVQIGLRPCRRTTRSLRACLMSARNDFVLEEQ